MSAIHQPAPWSRDKYGSVVDANGDSVLFRGVSTLSAGSDERIAMAEANTDLAAAAPMLLTELEKSARGVINLCFEMEVGRPATETEIDRAFQLSKPGTLVGDMVNAIHRARGAS